MRALKLFPILVGFCALALCVPTVHAQSPYQSSADFAKYAQKLRESALLKMEPTVQVQTSGHSTSLFGGRYPWRKDIVTTVFWIGEGTTARNPTPNRASSWDPNWLGNYGGVDRPDRRNGYLPASFIPGQNPFYCALPYNDVTRGTTKPEASFVIPWFRQAFQQAGHSVCKGRWLAIRHGSRVCYAQWEDCGPFRTDHWQYVFGKESDPAARPKPNINGGAGLDVSPAVRDFLGMNATKDVCDWTFVEFSEVPPGPWAKLGENNTFVLNARRGTERLASGKR